MALSPMMQEYLRCKEEYKDCILLYRVGDFYEMFFDDALTASKELEITLTGKDCGLPERAPMAGVPFHAVDAYIDRLVEKGYKAAICEQVEDPKTAKGLVKREVIRVVTPGTNLSAGSLAEDKNRYIACIFLDGDVYGLSFCDVSTGAFSAANIGSSRLLLDEIARFSPAEILCSDAVLLAGFPAEELREKQGVPTQRLDARFFSEEAASDVLKEHFRVAALEGLGLKDGAPETIAAGALLRYLYETQKNELPQIAGIRPYAAGQFMLLDTAAIRNLELTETLREKRKTGSLYGILDRTKTAMGARMVRSWITRPLIDRCAIEERLDAVEALTADAVSLAELREYLTPVYDLERLSGRVAYRTANPRDLVALRQSLGMLPAVKQLFASFPCVFFQALEDEFDDLSDICSWITELINDDPPLAMKEGGIIRDGAHPEVDAMRSAKTEGTKWLAELETRERELTGIPTLRVKYNRVFGYCIEVTNSFKDKVPDRYTRKQTLTGAERYTTPELKELEDRILGAQDKLYTIEYELFSSLRDRILDEISRILKTAEEVAKIDALASFAEVSSKNRYVRPAIGTDGKIVIKDGRHPVVERMTERNGFIPNDTRLDTDKQRVAIITGPNMAGKSTYMRQTALIVLMAQIGCFVPAKEAQIGIVDRIFTRVGASDDLASGQSTFMVEMTEVANILRNATKDSLLILDEIGRGTSTFDGLSIAWAVIEYIADPRIIGAKTLFATHYHELTELEGKIPGIRNYCIAVKERGDDIVFLRKIIRGGADKSYGIQAARLAGVPEAVLARAGEIVELLSDADITEAVRQVTGNKTVRRKPIHYDDVDLAQMSLFDTATDDDILKELDALDIGNLTPVEALNVLYKLQNKRKNRWKG